MTDDQLRNLKAARDEARLALDAIDIAIERWEELTENKRAAAVALFRDEAESRLRGALSQLKP